MPDSAGVTLTWLGCCRLLHKNFSVQQVIKRFLYSIVIFIPVFFFTKLNRLLHLIDSHLIKHAKKTNLALFQCLKQMSCKSISIY